MPLTKAFDLQGDYTKSQKDLVWDGKFLYSFQTEKVPTGNRAFRIETNGCSPDWALQVSGTVQNLYGVAYSGTVAVAVGDNGTILSSPDGVTWTPQASGVTVTLFCIVWNGAKFVAGGDQGVILTSPDGLTWTIQVNPTALPAVLNIIWDGNIFLAVGGTGFFETSPDGVIWSVLNTGVIEDLSGIAYSGVRYVAVGESGRVLLSQDAATWSTIPAFTTANFKGIVWDGKEFIAVAVGQLLFSSLDGTSWAVQNLDADPLSVSFNQNLILVTGTAGLPVTISSNNLNWFDPVTNSVNNLNASVWIGNSFVAVGDAGTITLGPLFISPCISKTWNPIVTGNVTTLEWVASNDVIMIAVGDTGTILSSTDGSTWNPETSGTVNNLNAICWDGSYFIAVGDAGTILLSPDGHLWSAATSPGVQALYGVVSNGFLAVAVGGNVNGEVYVSTTRTIWTANPSPSANILTSVCWNGLGFVAVGFAGTILTSHDGAHWRTEISGTGQTLYDIFFNGSQYVTVGNAGTILLSQDSIVWTTQVSGTIDILQAVIWKNFEWLAVGNNGTALESPDGVNWTTATTGIVDSMKAVTFFNNQFFSVLVTGDAIALIPIPGTVNFSQTFSGADSTPYHIEVILRSEVLGNPSVFLYDDNAGKSVGFLNTISCDKYFRKFSGTFTSGTGITTLTLYIQTSTQALFTPMVVEISRASVTDVTNPLFPVEKLTNTDFMGDVNPFNDIPDGWDVDGICTSAVLVAEQAETILNIYRYLVSGLAAETDQNGLFWHRISLATNRLSHIVLGGASFLDSTPFGPAIGLLLSYHDDGASQSKTELAMITTGSKKIKRFLVLDGERTAAEIGAATLFPSGGQAQLAFLQQDRFLQIYGFPDFPLVSTDPMQFVKQIVLAADFGTYKIVPKGMAWASVFNSFAILATNVDLPAPPALPIGLSGDWLYFVRVNASNFIFNDRLPEQPNLGVTYFNGRLLVSNPAPPSSPSLLGYVVDNVVTPFQIVENWSPAETVVADGTSEITLTLTIANELFGTVGPGVAVNIRGFKNASTLFRPEDFFDGQAMQDIARFKPVTASSQDVGNVSGINDDSLGTRWASTTIPANATIDLQFDYTVDLIYYNADTLRQKYKIELLNSLNAVLHTIDNTGSFSDPKALFDLDPAITTVRKLKLTINAVSAGAIIGCNCLSAFSGSTQILNGIFYLPGGRGLTLQDTSVYPFYLIGRTNDAGQIVIKYRSGQKGGFSPEQLEYQLLT